MTALSRLVPAHVRQRLKPYHRRGRRWLARRLHPYGVSELVAAVRALGIAPGDSVMMHSGFRSDSGFLGGPGDVVDGMLELLGPDGHLLMMSMAYGGASEDYCAGDPLFDAQRTPSALGIISEHFRRRPGVLRSLSPLHPVLAHGRLAAWFVADHESCLRSCGRGSPFDRLLRRGGKFLFLDASYATLTFMHHVEDHFAGRLPVPLYAERPVEVRARDRHGRELRVRQLCFSAQARAHRDFAPIERMLRVEGRLREGRVGRSRLLAVGARDVFDCAARLVEQGAGFYRQPSRAPEGGAA